MNEIIRYIILGIIQGIGEILPISSSGHLIVFGNILGIEMNISLEIILHLASLIAIIFYSRKEIYEIILKAFRYIFLKDYKDKNYLMFIIYLLISCIPICIISLLFSNIIDYINNSYLFIGILFMVNGLMLYIFNKINRDRNTIKLKDSLVIGIFQGFAVVPGLSRSGMCMCGGINSGLSKEKTLEYSFLLFIPVIILATFKELFGGFSIDLNNRFYYFISFIVSFIFTYLSLKFLKRIIKNNALKYFGYYTFLLGMIICIKSINIF